MTEYTCPFEVGDKVRVLGAPKADKDYSPGWNDSMDHYLDKICTVRSVQQQRDGRDELHPLYIHYFREGWSCR